MDPLAVNQVIHFLLAKNLRLTALELLVEAGESGAGDSLEPLRTFFSNPDRFPPLRVAKF